jgi:membrane protein implicated in regulation of membrane protease activity
MENREARVMKRIHHFQFSIISFYRILRTNMDQYLWILWLVLGVGLIIAEIFTMGFVLFWFGLGALAAALTGMMGGGFLLQFLVFAVVSVGLTIMSRTIFARYFSHSESDRVKTNVDALPGQIGTVTIGSQGALNAAAVKAYGSTWTAYPADDGDLLVEGEKVEIVEVKGASVYVRRVTKELPSWRQ